MAPQHLLLSTTRSSFDPRAISVASPRTPWTGRRGSGWTAALEVESSWPKADTSPSSSSTPLPPANDDRDEEDLSEASDQDDYAEVQAESENDFLRNKVVIWRVTLIGGLLALASAILSTVLNFKLSAPPSTPFVPILVSTLISEGVIKRILANNGMSIQEHTLIAVMASSGSFPYGANLIATLSISYGLELNSTACFLLLLCTQFLGYALVFPFISVLLEDKVNFRWPSSQILATLIKTLNPPPGGIRSLGSRSNLTVFRAVFVGCFIYQVLPSAIFPLLTSIATLCLSASTSPTIVALGSGYKGFGLLSFSLDWSAIGSSPILVAPLASSLSFFGGMLVFSWIASPLYWALNFWDCRKLPAIDPSLFSSDFKKVNLHHLLDSDVLSTNRYQLTPSSALGYAASFAALSSSLVIGFQHSSPQIASLFKPRLPSLAKQRTHITSLDAAIPPSWFLAIFIISIFLSTLITPLSPALDIPLSGIALSLLIAAVFIVPCGLVAATSGNTLGVNLMAQLLAGFIWTRRPAANMFVKANAHSAVTQAVKLLADLKLGRLTKTPAKQVFLSRCFGTLISTLTTHLTLHHIIAYKRPFLDGTVQSAQWSGRGTELFGTASGIFGIIGPLHFFSGRYAWLWLGFPVGVLGPFVIRFLENGSPSWKEKIDPTLVFMGFAATPEKPTSVIAPSILTALFAHVWVRESRPEWYRKLKIVTAGLDSSTSLLTLLVFLVGMSGLFSSWFGAGLESDPEGCGIV